MSESGTKTNETSFPFKESIDYAKNLAFCIGIEAFVLTTTWPYEGKPDHAWWQLFNAIMGMLVGLLTSWSTRAYAANFPTARYRTKAILMGLSIVAVLGAAFFVRARLAST